MITKHEIVQLINTATGKEEADLVIKNCKIVDVESGEIRENDIAISNSYIAGTESDYKGKTIIDGQGCYAIPGLIDAHIHIESSYLCPEEFSCAVVPCGTTTVIADPHEITNVSGLTGLDYMERAAAHTPLKIEYMIPSCVPSTTFETSGAVLKAKDLEKSLFSGKTLGLAEIMSFPAVIDVESEVLDKILLAIKVNKPIDGHAPGLHGKELNAYAAAGILTDHECSTLSEMQERLRDGMYVLLREGSSCHNLKALLPGITYLNYTHCLLCSDDLHAGTILRKGHMNNHLKICVDNGINPIMAVRMATLNTAEAYGLSDRGAIAPGKKADIVLVKDLVNFEPIAVFINGKIIAEHGKYLPKVSKTSILAVNNSFNIKNFNEERLHFQLKSNRVRVIEIIPREVMTKSIVEKIKLSPTNDIILGKDDCLNRLAVIERHNGTGNVGLGLLKNYNLKQGAIATSIAHDSHNIMLVGKDTKDMAIAVNELCRQNGGVVIVLNGKVINRLPLPIGGLMSDRSAQWVSSQLVEVERDAHAYLGIQENIDPIMTLSFMSLPVIPELKLTDKGLVDINRNQIVSLEI